MRRALILPTLLATMLLPVPALADSDCEVRPMTVTESALVEKLAAAGRLLPRAPAGWDGDEAMAPVEVSFCKNVDYGHDPKLLSTSVTFRRVDSEEQAQRNAEQMAAALQKHGSLPPELADRLFNTDRVAQISVELNAASASCAGRRRALQVPGASVAWLCQIGWNQNGRQDDQQQGEHRFNAQIVALFGPWRPEVQGPEDLAFTAQFKSAQPYTALQTLSLNINADQARAEALLKQINTGALSALLNK